MNDASFIAKLPKFWEIRDGKTHEVTEKNNFALYILLVQWPRNLSKAFLRLSCIGVFAAEILVTKIGSQKRVEIAFFRV